MDTALISKSEYLNEPASVSTIKSIYYIGPYSKVGAGLIVKPYEVGRISGSHCQIIERGEIVSAGTTQAVTKMSTSKGECNYFIMKTNTNI